MSPNFILLIVFGCLVAQMVDQLIVAFNLTDWLGQRKRKLLVDCMLWLLNLGAIPGLDHYLLLL